MPSLTQVRPYYARQAETLLNAWICGDAGALKTQLNRTANFFWPAGGGIEGYLAELLQLVAQGMRKCPDLYAPAALNPPLGIYLDVLQCLSAI
jgi:hypothetical protein